MTPRSAEIVTILLYLIIPALSVAVYLCAPDFKTHRFKLPWNSRLYSGYVDSDPSRPASAMVWSFCIASVLFILCINSIVFQALSILEWNFCAPTPLHEGVYVFVWVFFVLLSVMGTLLAFLSWAYLLKMLVRPSQADLLAERGPSRHVNFDPEMGHPGSVENIVERSGRVSVSRPVSANGHGRGHSIDDGDREQFSTPSDGQEHTAGSPQHALHREGHQSNFYSPYDSHQGPLHRS